jgi:serine/threonine protein kinase/Tfp pilus assembly protein PilF
MADEKLEIHSIFNEAIALGSEKDRVRYLDQACCDNLQVRARVEALLRAHSEAGGFFGGKSPTGVATEIRPLTESLGTEIGPYKLLQQIGEGGMGTVYMAEQSEPVQRKVALKLIKPGMDSRQVISRFEAERQALALMDHPHIAKVLDAGTTEAGLPYFVMELVKGTPITKYCDEHHLTPRERLELFIPVCQAVQHAHQKGIIHRDLKPSNVLVALYDGRPVPKVIDFGVAKATGQKLTERTMYTEFGAIVGTLEYMSPEQAESNQLDIDTRSDVYSLGVLLYELLTGTTPFEKKRLKDAALLEILRIIREDEPQKPSTRLSTTDELPSISANRGLEPNKLSALVRGELDWIVMKALEKDRNRRYETANGFALDIQRYLADEPVAACPPSAIYRLRKFARRNKAAFAIGTTIAAALVVAIVALVVSNVLVRSESRQKEIALEEKDRALEQKDEALIEKDEALKQKGQALIEKGEALTAAENAAAAEKAANTQAQKRLAQIEKANDILGSIFENLDPSEIAKAERPLQAILVEKLDRAVAELEGEAIGDPLVVATVQDKFGASLLGLGEPEKAIVLLEKTRGTRQAKLGREDPETLHSMHLLASAYRDAGMLHLALPLCEETLKLRKARLGPEHPYTLSSMNSLAQVYRDAGKLDLALPLFEETLQLEKSNLGIEHPYIRSCMNNLAAAYQDAGKLELALPLFEETLQLSKANRGPEHPETLTNMNNLAMAYQAARKLDLAVPLLEETLRLRKSRQGPEHPLTLTSMNNLALAYLAAGKLHLALPLFEETLQLRKTKVGPEHPDTLMSMNNLASAYRAAGKLDLALPLFKEDLQLSKAKLGPDHPHTLKSMNNLGVAYLAAGKLELALPLFEETVQLSKAKLGPDHPHTLKSMNNLALAYLDAGKLDLALPLFEETLKLSNAKFGPAHPDTLQRMNNLADIYERLGRQEELIGKLSDLLKLQSDNLNVWHRRGLAQLKAGKWDEAVAGFAEPLDREPANAREWQLRGDRFVRLALWPEAAADYAHADELQEPPDAMASYLHALARLYAGDVDGYRKISRRIAERFAEAADPENAYLIAFTGAIDSHPAVEPAQLVTLAERAVAGGKFPWRVACLALAYQRAGQSERAVASLQESLAINAGWNPLWIYSTLAMARHRLGNQEEASAALDKARSARDARVESMLAGEIGFVPALWWDLLHAELLYREAHTLIDGSPPPDDPRLLVLRARRLEVIGRADDAQALFVRALALQPEDLRIRIFALPHASRTEACAQGLADLRKVLTEHPNQQEGSHLALAQAHLQFCTRQWLAGHRPEAEAEFRNAAALQPSSAPLQFAIGTSRAQLGQWNEAAAGFDRALKLDSTNHQNWYLAATLHAAAGDREAFSRTCREILSRFNGIDNAQMAERTTKVCLLLPETLSAGEFDRVQKLAERAVTGTEKDGYFGFFAMAKGLADYRARRYEEAIQWLERSKPNADGIHWDATKFALLSMAHHGLGQWEEARTSLAKAQAIMARKSPDPVRGLLFSVGDWHDWAHALIFFREAEALLAGDGR